jgi:uncharacterized membrane protein YgcG
MTRTSARCLLTLTAVIAIALSGTAAHAARPASCSAVPGGNLDVYEQQLQQECGWADAANVRRPKLLVLIVETNDRTAGIYPGASLAATITDPVTRGIEQANIRPHLADGDWDGGLQAGLSALDGTLATQQPEAAAATAATLVGSSTPPPDHGGSDPWALLFVLALLVLAVLGSIGSARSRRRRYQSHGITMPFDTFEHGVTGGTAGWAGGGGVDDS